jgi:hypothetical protein
MVSLTLEQILQLHALVLVKDGGADGVRDVGRLEGFYDVSCRLTEMIY